jgi:hypothetical protein
MGGIINPNFLAGAAPGVAQMGAQLTAYGMTKSLQDQQEQARRDMEERISERTRGEKNTDYTRKRLSEKEDYDIARANAKTDLTEKRTYEEGQDKIKHERAKGLIQETAKVKVVSEKDKKNPAAWIGAGNNLTKLAGEAETMGDTTRAEELKTQAAEFYKIAKDLQGVESPSKKSGIDALFPARTKSGEEQTKKYGQVPG